MPGNPPRLLRPPSKPLKSPNNSRDRLNAGPTFGRLLGDLEQSGKKSQFQFAVSCELAKRSGEVRVTPATVETPSALRRPIAGVGSGAPHQWVDPKGMTEMLGNSDALCEEALRSWSPMSRRRFSAGRALSQHARRRLRFASLCNNRRVLTRYSPGSRRFRVQLKASKPPNLCAKLCGRSRIRGNSQAPPCRSAAEAGYCPASAAANSDLFAMRLIFVRNVATLLIGNARFCAPKEGGAWELLSGVIDLGTL
jgi:hypothetical protein